jgi:hypothetical protein
LFARGPYLSTDEADVRLAGGAPDVGEKLLKCEGNAVVTLGAASLGDAGT